MTRAIDVAKYLVEKYGEMSAMKLHKLAYYCQAWHMVWFEKELFPEDFQAWANGPVIRSLYTVHRKQFLVNSTTFQAGDSGALSEDQKVVIDKVMSFYGDKTAQWLSDLTHREAPWVEARGELPPGAASETVIDKGSIHEYYSAL
ncbi:Panacea domain-containing protein [Roseateles sp.]|uniref:Panacea domain-containing protein n=1 Tax=Roseateles sp. TaxID=1971397 RepID=UPI002DF878B7|nr:type II toxin-antitoxin system antitoxin SocA domain-containing protein [Roseateles sp.]